MAEFDLSQIKEQARINFVEAWMSTAGYIPTDTRVSLSGKGKPHPLRELIQKSREILLNLGFDEVENLTILPDSDVVKQYGPESRVILDRAFYLAELPRSEIGVSARKMGQVEKIAGRKVDVESLQMILRGYKKGDIEADDLIEKLMDGLGISDYQATEIVDKVFPELYSLRPLPSNKTLRSHMTATWFHTLAALQDRAALPLCLFSVGPRYRNEQREDAHHLRVHHSASLVIMDPEMSLAAGRAITEEVLGQYGFADVKFERKAATSKYYAPGHEEEVFATSRGDLVEIADIGMYSPIALANFNIRYPVFNAGIGIERLAMVLSEADDVRRLVFPQFSVFEYSDEEIAKSVEYISSPQSDRGREMARAIEGSAREHKDEVAPCEFLAWSDDSVEVWVVEEEASKRLIGPAGFNEICVAGGTIYSDVVASGVWTGVNYMRGIAMGAAALVEKSDNDIVYQVKTVKHLSDLNLQIPEAIRQYIEGQQKPIGVGGAVFVAIKAHVLGGKSREAHSE